MIFTEEYDNGDGCGGGHGSGCGYDYGILSGKGYNDLMDSGE